jgi:hypothetical protein
MKVKVSTVSFKSDDFQHSVGIHTSIRSFRVDGRIKPHLSCWRDRREYRKKETRMRSASSMSTGFLISLSSSVPSLISLMSGSSLRLVFCVVVFNWVWVSGFDK